MADLSAFNNAIQSAQNAAASAAASAQSAAQNAAQQAQSAAQQAQNTAQQAQETAQNTAQNAVESATGAAENMAASAQNAAQQAQDAAQSAAQQAQEAGTAAADQAQAMAQSAADQAEAAAQEAQAAAEQAVQQAEAAAQAAAQQAEAAAQEAQAAAEQAAQQAEAAAQEAQAAAEQAAQEAQASVDQAVQEAQAAVDEAQAQLDQAQAEAEAAVGEAQAQAQAAVDEAQAQLDQAVEQGTAAVEQAQAEAEAAAQQAQAAAEQAAQAATQAAEAAAQQAEAAAQQVQAAAQAAAQQAQAAAQQATQAVQAAAAQAQAAAQQATQAAQVAAQEAQQALQQTARQLQNDVQAGVTSAVADLLDLPIVDPPEITPEKRGDPASTYDYQLKIDGQKAPPELVDRVIELTVDDSLHLPDMFTLEIDDKNQEWMDADLFKIGAQVEIEANLVEGSGNTAAVNLLLKGEITALEPEFSEAGESILMVRGYDYAYLMHRTRKSRSFLNMTDSEMAQKIAREAGLTAKVDATSVVYDYVFQNNLTDLQFLVSRAQRIGYQVYVEEKTLYFLKYPASQTASPELRRGENLLSFQPRLTVVDQVDEVIVRGWDPRTKKEIIGRARSGPQQSALDGISETGAQLASKAFNGSAETVVVDRPVVNLNEANALAQALFDEINNSFIQGEGLCLGDPRVTAGQTIKISGVGRRFGGSYYVTSATHIFSPDVGYHTRFTISGRRPDIISGLIMPENGNGHVPHRLNGVVVGLVTNNKDPEDLGRVKVKYPWLSDTEESYWLRVSQAGGVYSLPDINQEVLVAFEHGDIHAPYIVGVLWNGKDIPTKKAGKTVGSDGKVMHRSLLSNAGHELFLDDTPGSEQIVVRDKNGNEIVIDTPQNQMSINVKGNLKIDAKGNIDITGTGNVNIKGAMINLN